LKHKLKSVMKTIEKKYIKEEITDRKGFVFIVITIMTIGWLGVIFAITFVFNAIATYIETLIK